MATKTKEVFRWIGFIPDALTAAWLAWILINFLGQFSLGYVGAEPDSFMYKFYFATTGHAAMGAAFVYCGARIAPAKQYYVAYFTAGVGLVITGFSLFPLLMESDWWLVWGAFCTIFGIGAVTFSIHKGHVDFTESLL